ncbi:hypothetical protein HU200_043071 [Digitaria exilis]|uniref:MINDY deubiquitinase domain-containing protein n=1 Tax=Digitaria exilis TaxID=1010633 RepID=A0A835EFG3_9POAL|nr:hypothetical protein HU200_043071 [Digitaria exilis]
MSSLYEKRPLDANGNLLGMVLQGTHGSADLVAIYNMVTLKYSSVYGQQGPVTEGSLKSIINEMLDQCIRRVQDISAAQAMQVKHVLYNIRTDFSLQPLLSDNMDFVTNPSYLLCRILGLTVLHAWVLDPQVSGYDSLNRFSHEELLKKHTCDLQLQGQNDQVIYEGLLDDYKNQLTSYGFKSLPAELTDDAIALLFCRNRLNIIHKHCGVVYIYVTDEDVCKQMPGAVWMLFEECHERNIYFTEKYIPVKGQPCEKEARQWYMRFLLQTQMKDESQMEDETRMKNKNAARNKIKKEKRKLRQSSQQGLHGNAI